MTDAATAKSLQVSTLGTAGPYIRLPLSQVDDVKRLLDTHHIHYWVHENAISTDGGPYMAIIELGSNGNATAVQLVLDRVG